jgi:hypothetical protein
MIRLAIAEYIASELERIKASGQPLYGQGVGRALWVSKRCLLMQLTCARFLSLKH